MPRKPHRPPTTAKRRKTKKTTVPYTFDRPAEPENGDVAVEVADEVVIPEATVAEVVTAPLRSGASEPAARAPTKHVSRDYSYVRSEVLRIVLVAGFLITALIITSILRG